MRALGYVLAIAAVLWVPAALIFLVAGIWGDPRWTDTGILMIGVAGAAAVIAAIAFKITPTKSGNSIDLEWEEK